MGVVLEIKLKTWQDKALIISFYPLFIIGGWLLSGWSGVLIGLFIALQVKAIYPRWDFGLTFDLVDRAMGNMQLAGSKRSSYCLDFGDKKRIFIYRDNRNGSGTVRLGLLLNEELWPEMSLRDKAFTNKAGIGVIWSCFDEKRGLTALFPTARGIDQRKTLITMLQAILTASGLDLEKACGKVHWIKPDIGKKLYAPEGNLRSVLVRHDKWSISHDLDGKYWIETLPRDAVDYHIRPLNQKELKRYKHEGKAFLRNLPDDCVRPGNDMAKGDAEHQRSASNF